MKACRAQRPATRPSRLSCSFSQILTYARRCVDMDLAARASRNALRASTSSAEIVSYQRPAASKMMRNARGQMLYTVHYSPPARVALKAALVFHHGLGEHIGRYARVFNLMAAHGYAVHGLDAHGHGRSEPAPSSPDRCLIQSLDHLVDDLLQLVTEEVLPQYAVMMATRPPLPLFIGGSSMGALVACHAALQTQGLWSGLILHSAAIDVDWTPLLRLQARLGGLMAALIPRARIVPAVRPQDMSTDPETVRHYIEDPLNFVGNVRAKTGYEILKGFRSLTRKQQAMQLPIFACHGTDDHCTSLQAVQKFLKAVQSKDTTLHMVQGGYHELLQGPEWKDCTKRIIGWMDAHLPEKLPVAPSPQARIRQHEQQTVVAAASAPRSRL